MCQSNGVGLLFSPFFQSLIFTNKKREIRTLFFTGSSFLSAEMSDALSARERRNTHVIDGDAVSSHVITNILTGLGPRLNLALFFIVSRSDPWISKLRVRTGPFVLDHRSTLGPCDDVIAK